MAKQVSSYFSWADAKKRLQLFGTVSNLYLVTEYEDGAILLTPKVLNNDQPNLDDDNAELIDKIIDDRMSIDLE